MKHPKGVIEDVLVQTDNFYFPNDFIIIINTAPIANVCL